MKLIYHVVIMLNILELRVNISIIKGAFCVIISHALVEC